MIEKINKLRRQAKALRKDISGGEPLARKRVLDVLPEALEALPLKHADALHVVAREQGHKSWPRLKASLETAALDRSAKAEKLKLALFTGNRRHLEAILAAAPDIAGDNLGLACALYRTDLIAAALEKDRLLATRLVGVRTPLLHLCFSRFHLMGGAIADATAVAGLLVAAGASVDESYPSEPGSDHRLSALYGALGHAQNLELAKWLLERGANPDDDESLYHSTELGHHEGLKLLLRHGARPGGTSALPRALDFNDFGAVQLLLDAGADPNEGWVEHPSGQPSGLLPALHQAARRMCSAEIAELLLQNGADPTLSYQGHTAYAFARVYGNVAVAQAIEASAGALPLSPVEHTIARAVEGTASAQDRIDVASLSDELQRLLTRLVWQEGTLPALQRLVAIGFDPDQTDEMGTPPVQLAGWEGMPDKMAFFLTLGPDIDFVNGYGGTLFSTVLHGSENCPQRAERDHIGCMRLALEAGAKIPRAAIDGAVDDEMAAFLEDWAEAQPGQVVEDGPW
ncbi:MAG: ankyrin repeat domain-containing protein [Pseudomonadota bacterium]